MEETGSETQCRAGNIRRSVSLVPLGSLGTSGSIPNHCNPRVPGLHMAHEDPTTQRAMPTLWLRPYWQYLGRVSGMRGIAVRPFTRTCRFCRWSGLLLCTLLAIVWLATLHYGVFLPFNLKDGHTVVRIAYGSVTVFRKPGTASHRAFFFRNRSLRWTWQAGFQRYPRGAAGFGSPVGPRWGFVLVLPIWIPLAIAVIPTASLWTRAKRRSPESCQKCGYDLTGNVSGVCPECGSEKRRSGSARRRV